METIHFLANKYVFVVKADNKKEPELSLLEVLNSYRFPSEMGGDFIITYW